LTQKSWFSLNKVVERLASLAIVKLFMIMLILLEETTCIGHKKEQPEDDSQQTLDHLIQHPRKYDPKNPKQVLVTRQ